MFGYEHESVSLRWAFSKPVDLTWSGDFYAEADASKVVCGWSTARSGYIHTKYGYGYDAGKVTVDVRRGSTRVSITLHDLQQNDAKWNYALRIVNDKYSVVNRRAWIVLYGK